MVPWKEITQVKNKGWNANKKRNESQTQIPFPVTIPLALGIKQNAFTSSLYEVVILGWLSGQRDVKGCFGEVSRRYLLSLWPKIESYDLELSCRPPSLISPPISWLWMWLWGLELQQPFSDHEVTSLRSEGNTKDDRTGGCEEPRSLTSVTIA